MNTSSEIVVKDMLLVTPDFIKLHKQYLIPSDEQNG